MKCKNLKMIGLIALSFIAFEAFSQNTVSIKTGFNGRGYSGWPWLEQNFNQGKISLIFSRAESQNKLKGLYQVNFDLNSMQPIDTVRMLKPFQPGNITEDFVLLKDDRDNNQFHLSYYLSSDTLFLDFYRITNSYTYNGLAFDLNFKNRFLYGATLIDSEIILLASDRADEPDSIFVTKLDLNGRKIKEAYYTDSTAVSLKTIRYRGIYPHPANDSLLVLPSFENENDYLVTVKIDDLQDVTEFSIDTLFYPKNGILGTFSFNFTMGKDFFAYSGTALKLDFFPNIPNSVPFYYRRNWKNDSVELRVFGKIEREMSSYATLDDSQLNFKFIAGSVPFRMPFFSDNERREVVIYRWNDWGEDSIALFGEQNHVLLDMLASPNDDLFVCGTYNNYPNSDSNFVFLTKIPRFAISLVEREKVSHRFQIYPNPAVKKLHLSNVRNSGGMPFKVFNERGQEVLAGVLNTPEIEVGQLLPGVYILVLGDFNSSAGIFIKK